MPEATVAESVLLHRASDVPVDPNEGRRILTFHARDEGRTEDAEFHVYLPQESFLIVQVGGKPIKSVLEFEHPAVLARRKDVYDLKHYHSQRGKWWTQEAGVTFYFAIPMSRVFIQNKPTYSYVRVFIGDDRKHSHTLSVSGGTRDGWSDFVSQGASLCIGHSVSSLRRLAEAALTLEEYEALDDKFSFNIRAVSAENFNDLVSKPVVLANIEAGSKVMLGNGYTLNGSKGPFTVDRKPKRRRHLIIKTPDAYGHYAKARYTELDWRETAIVNEWTVPDCEDFNHIGEIEPAT